MSSPAGDVAVTRLVVRLLNRVDELDTAPHLIAAVRAGMERIAANHPEVWDCEPRTKLYQEAVRPIAEEHGYENEVGVFF
jgi:hypothetical protein